MAFGYSMVLSWETGALLWNQLISARFGISIYGCKQPLKASFKWKWMGAIQPFSKLMGAIATIDPP